MRVKEFAISVLNNRRHDKSWEVGLTQQLDISQGMKWLFTKTVKRTMILLKIAKL